LYGFSADHFQRYLPPVHGSQPGGRLLLDTTRG